MHDRLSIYQTNTGLSIYQIIVRPHFVPTMLNLHNIQSSSSGGENDIIMSVATTNRLLLQSCI